MISDQICVELWYVCRVVLCLAMILPNVMVNLSRYWVSA